MARKVLFSPVGGTDPISADNARDGSMLHILRKRLPDAVYLYLSSEMLELQEKDQRYTRAVEKLCAETGHPIDCHVIERPDLRNVQEFDVFYWDFRREILGIIEREGLRAAKDLLVNTSSGTPAMKNALVVLNALGGLKCTLVQVSAPGRKMGTHTHPADYDLDKLWELDEDREPGSEDRTKDVRSQNLLGLSNLQTVRNFIDSYDYEAAWELGKTLPPEISEGIMPFLRLGRARVTLSLREAEQACADAGLDPADVFPVPLSDPAGKVFEYALCCDVRRKRGELADFIRSLTPLIAELFELVIEKQLSIRIHDYCTVRKFSNGASRYEWDQNKIFSHASGDAGAAILSKAFRDYCAEKKISPERLRLGSISSDHLAAIIDSACGDEVRAPVRELRKRVEQTIRNAAAHEIVSVDEEFIMQLTSFNGQKGLDSAGIWRLVRNVASLAGFSREIGWQSYDHMNRLIKDALRTAGVNSGFAADVLQD